MINMVPNVIMHIRYPWMNVNHVEKIYDRSEIIKWTRIVELDNIQEVALLIRVDKKKRNKFSFLKEGLPS